MTAAVIDASALVAVLTDSGPVGVWATGKFDGRPLAAPHLVLFETANVLRRLELAGHLSRDIAALAQRDLGDVPVDLWPYRPLAARVWELRQHVSAYDASYVALAELLGVELITLDTRLAAAHGLRCRMTVPPSG